MDRLNFVRDGMSRLPPGFRFQPTEEELVFQYLKCKVFSCALPASIIPEIINVCNYDPWDLPGGDTEEERYFFSNSNSNSNTSNSESKYRNGNGSSRGTINTPSGYWKVTGCGKTIVSSTSRNRNATMGIKKTLVFYTRKPCFGYSRGRTAWIMHEYRLVSTQTCAKQIGEQMEKWVVCSIYWKNDKGRVRGSGRNDSRVSNDLVGERDTASLSSAASSSSSSGTVSETSSTSTSAAPHQSDACGCCSDDYSTSYYNTF